MNSFGPPNVESAAAEGQPRTSLYKSRRKFHPKLAHGDFRKLKWAMMIVTLAIYYVTPWLRWDRGPGAPDQAVLVDFPGRRFYFFFIEIWPQELYFVAGLLIMAGIGLFLTTSVAGRMWCGYACPQTVWTDLFIHVERLIEGDRNARIKLDAAPWSLEKIAKRVSKHTIWLLIGLVTGGAWIFYFVDAPTLARQIAELDAPFIAYGTVAFFTGMTYVMGGLMREQVCTYMCPWPRIMGAMMDEESLVVTYRESRGEPRGFSKCPTNTKTFGDCVDCGACVAVCPMGIDIGKGQQLECITCALCIDACNEVMERLKRPRNLIGYASIAGEARAAQGGTQRIRPIRPRTLAYFALWASVGLIMLYALASRSTTDLNVLHDRNPLSVLLADGSVRNAYTFKVLNKTHQTESYRVSAEGLAGAVISVVGAGELDHQAPVLTVEPDSVQTFRVLVTVPKNALPKEESEFTFVLSPAAAQAVKAETRFWTRQK
jgi:cytochrome c oxidase accessory protein FixG